MSRPITFPMTLNRDYVIAIASTKALRGNFHDRCLQQMGIGGFILPSKFTGQDYDTFMEEALVIVKRLPAGTEFSMVELMDLDHMSKGFRIGCGRRFKDFIRDSGYAVLAKDPMGGAIYQRTKKKVWPHEDN